MIKTGYVVFMSSSGEIRMTMGEKILEGIKSGIRIYESPDVGLELYHGSRHGIRGKIVPGGCEANSRSDFGKGFYLGSSKDQAGSLVLENQSAELYLFRLEFTGLDSVILTGAAWLSFICWNRQWFSEKAEKCLSRIFSPLLERDVIIGEIADDRMQQALAEFREQNITDAGLSACLKAARLGTQYVLKTERACDALKTIRKINLSPEERKKILNRAFSRYNENMRILRETKIKQIRRGLYFTEIQEAIEEMCDADQCHPIHL